MIVRAFLTAALVLTASSHLDAQNNFTDKASHQSGFVQANGVRLHYLDYGGHGRPLVFLAGLGNSAHIFDDVAPQFTGHYHVIALTRRGHGASAAPASGYDLPTLVEDIRAALDSLHVKKATLVAHSFAGDEISLFATKYPKRVDKLIYLEAAYDRSLPMPANPNPAPKMTKDDVASFDAYKAYFQRARGYWSDAVEADLRATSLGSDGNLKSTLSRDVMQAIMKNGKDYPVSYSHIKAPILAIYNQPADSARHAYEQQNIAKLEAEHPRHLKIVEIPGGNHYIFVTNRDAVLNAVKDFLK